MSIIHEQRGSDSPYVEAITRGWTVSEGSTIRPSECNWHMVFVKEHGRTHRLVVGPLSMAGLTSWGEGAEVLWIKFKNAIESLFSTIHIAIINLSQAFSNKRIYFFWIKFRQLVLFVDVCAQ